MEQQRIYLDTMYLVAYAFRGARHMDGFDRYFKRKHAEDIDRISAIDGLYKDAEKRKAILAIPSVVLGEVIKKCVDVVDDYENFRKSKKSKRGAGRRPKSNGVEGETVLETVLRDVQSTYLKRTGPFRIIGIGGPTHDSGIDYDLFIRVLNTIHEEFPYFAANYADRIILGMAAADRFATSFVTADRAIIEFSDLEGLVTRINELRKEDDKFETAVKGDFTIFGL